MAVSWPEIAAHRERLVRVARRRVPTREDAEDVVHEAMLRCATFEELDEARLGQFLTAVTMRLCADVYRHTERATRAARRLDAGGVTSPEEAACAAAEVDELRALLASLPDKQRDVLVDRASGLSVSEISSRHALTYKATESALSRARSTMRLALAAGLSFLGAVVATVRRRPSVALAAPLTAIAFVTTVVHMPHGATVPPRAVLLDPPRVAPTPPATGIAAPSSLTAPNGAASGGVRPGDDGSGSPAPRPHRTKGIGQGDIGPLHGDVYKDERHSIVFYPNECLSYGWHVEPSVEPPKNGGYPHASFDEYCEPPPG